MKSRIVLTGILAFVCASVVAGCERPAEEASSAGPTAQLDPDLEGATSFEIPPGRYRGDTMGITRGMTPEEVEAKVGEPTVVGSVFVTAWVTPPLKLYIYNKRPRGVFYVQFDEKDAVVSTYWGDE